MTRKYDGMTVNERLYVSGLLNEYDAAVKVKNIKKIKEILTAVELDEANIKPILERIISKE